MWYPRVWNLKQIEWPSTLLKKKHSVVFVFYYDFRMKYAYNSRVKAVLLLFTETTFKIFLDLPHQLYNNIK